MEKTSSVVCKLPTRLSDIPRSPERLYPKIIVATDFEGPLVLGDTALEVMSRKVRPESATESSPDYGGIIYNETYDWYTKRTLPARKGRYAHMPEGMESSISEEGSDIALALAPLLATNTDSAFINNVAMESQQTPGSQELLNYLNGQGAIVTAITTSWQEPNQHIANAIGVQNVIGTPFPIDAAKKCLQDNGRWNEEIGMTLQFLTDSYHLIDKRELAVGQDKDRVTNELHERIQRFYEDELGISYDPLVRRERTGYKTMLGEIIESIQAVGDATKANSAASLFKEFSTDSVSPQPLTITMGDGLNDTYLLLQGKYSIGINGPDAVRAAKIGVITDNVSVLIPLIETFKTAGNLPLEQIIERAQQAVGDRAIFHKGGPDVSPELLALHKKMKKEIRGARGALIP